MPIITLTTDFGAQSHFVAELKGKIAKILPQCSVIDITHALPPFQLIETSFILKNSIFHFPENTIHAVGVDSSLAVHKALVIAKFKGQFIIAADNGIIPLVFSDSDFEYKRIEVKENDYFSFKNSFTNYLLKLIDLKYNLNKMEGLQENIKLMVLQKPVLKDNLISFDIIYIDSFGNAYTNLTQHFFEESVGIKKFSLSLSRFESVDAIHNNYTDVPEGDKVCFFDENGYMVIAINRGRANQLLGLKRDSRQLLIEILD
ncbi:MAG: S-adenosyl-l-methionine hydroxide adenosyltransferase family protein [Bacteroidia bacterium]